MLASIKSDPEITLLFSFIIYFFDFGLNISRLLFGNFSKYSDWLGNANPALFFSTISIILTAKFSLIFKNSPQSFVTVKT